MPPNHKLNERQEKFLMKLLDAQNKQNNPNAIKAVQQMQLRIKEFEQEIIDTHTKKLDSLGEFKTVGEATEYCRMCGVEISAINPQLFQIAGALMDQRKNYLSGYE